MFIIIIIIIIMPLILIISELKCTRDCKEKSKMKVDQDTPMPLLGVHA